MADGDERAPLITPPPGLLPPARPRPDADEVVNTGSATRKIRRDEPATPVFFATTTARPSPAPDRTVAAEGTVVVWNLQLPDGSWHEVPAGGIVLGRNPVAPDDRPDAGTLGLEDPERSVSKTHALLEVDGGTLLVTDLASTNGVSLGIDESTARLAPRAPTPVPDGAVLALGSLALRVRRGRKLA